MLIQELAEWQSDPTLEAEQLAYQLATITEQLAALKASRTGKQTLRQNAASIEKSVATLMALTMQEAA